MWIYIKWQNVQRKSERKFHSTNLKIKAKSSFISSESLKEKLYFRLKSDPLDTFRFHHWFSFFFVFPEFFVSLLFFVALISLNFVID